MSKRRFLFLVLLSLTLSLMSMDYTADYQSGVAVFKIKPAYRELIRHRDNNIGISSLDSRLSGIGLTQLQPRFRTNPKRYKPGLPDLTLIYEIRFAPTLSPIAVCNLLQSDPYIQYAEPLYIDQILDIPNDPFYTTDQLYFPSMQAEAAWTIHKGENGSTPVIIAIVDTGVNWTNAEYAPNIWHNLGEDANGNGYTFSGSGSSWAYDPGDLNGIDDDGNGFIDDLSGWDFMLNAQGAQNNDPWEAGAHGTGVTSYANAVTNNSLYWSSLAWNVTTMPISCSYPGSSSVYRGYDAIIYAAENGADIINCSWGSTSYSQVNQDVIDYAYGLGSIIIAAAGNSNNQVPVYPSAYANVVATGALLNDGTKSNLSSYGIWVDLAAPNQTPTSTGATSFASPIASSLAALIKSYHPTWTREQVITQLIASCDNIDAMNPGKENMLGQGKLNAYRALTDIDPVPDQELRLALQSTGVPTDANANGAVEQGEQFSLNLTLRNYSYGVSSTGASFTLSSTDPAVTILTNTAVVDIPADAFFDLSNAFLVQVSPTATSKYVTFTLTPAADKPIVFGTTLSFSVLINAGGCFVWEGKAGGRDMSGNYIKTRLTAMGKQVTYGTTFPASFYTFDAVFLSFGMVGSNVVRFDTVPMYNAVRDYLESGGKIYIEGGDAVGFDLGEYLIDVDGTLDADEVLWPLLGISSAEDGDTNVISNLTAENGWHTAPLVFSSSNQTKNDWVDTFSPNLNGVTAFVENTYGNVAIESIGSFGQRTFVFSYALNELVDGTAPNTKAELLSRIVDFFETDTFTLPDIRNYSITDLSDSSIQLSWDYPFEVGSFLIFSGDDPAILIESDGTTEQQIIIDTTGSPHQFYRISARREFGL
ncbi:MAG: serine peptidase precursor [Candidatus Cloacimonetes bacterium HGW-Cloacimonetes-1]|jgi:hypothetical protein|nr:MAG: serine peptidase precursor [Candidatus Cloacimonetes bacterium HGW-Cloacimonetes-1]